MREVYKWAKVLQQFSNLFQGTLDSLGVTALLEGRKNSAVIYGIYQHESEFFLVKQSVGISWLIKLT